MTRSHSALPRTYPQGKIAFCLLCLISLCLLFYSAETAVEAMRAGLRLCAVTVIPSLFPFMVLSELIVKSGAATPFGRLLAPLFRRLFGIGADSSTALLLGIVGGFPIGARTAASLYENGRIGREELSLLLCFCNVPSSAFLIHAVGLSLFGSRSFGNLLFALTLISAVLIGIGARIVMQAGKSPSCAPTPQTENSETPPNEKALTIFTNAIADSARAMLSVCAFIVFFATLVGCLSHLFEQTHAPAALSAFAFSFFEMTGGVAHAAACRDREIAMLLCAFAVGWSGLSVHFQIMSLCDRAPISFRPYFVAKAAQGLLNVILLKATLVLFQPNLAMSPTSTPAYRSYSKTAIGASLAVFVIGVAIAMYRRQKKKRKPRVTKKETK